MTDAHKLSAERIADVEHSVTTDNLHLIGASPAEGMSSKSAASFDVDNTRWRSEAAGLPREVRQAMSRRLAVCWNACRGYRTEDIEAGVMGDGYNMAVELAKAVIAGSPDAVEIAQRFRAHHDKMFHAFDVAADEAEALSDDDDESPMAGEASA